MSKMPWEPTAWKRIAAMSRLKESLDTVPRLKDEQETMCRLGAVEVIKWLSRRCEHTPWRFPCPECYEMVSQWASQIEEGK